MSESHLYEVEVKALVPSSRIIDVHDELAGECESLRVGNQINWYYRVPTRSMSNKPLTALDDAFWKPYMGTKRVLPLDMLNNQEVYNSISVRLRAQDETQKDTILVVKASQTGDAVNGGERREFEVNLPITIGEAEELLLSAGYGVSSKWSRRRRSYVIENFPSITATLDYNAGYGWVLELETIVFANETTTEAREMLLRSLNKMGLEELPQPRLQRMFKHYEAHWQDYYGTEKTFVIE